MDYKESFSTKLLNLRKENDLSLEALGNILGISNQAVSLLEKGKRSPSFEIFFAIAEYFNVSTDFFQLYHLCRAYSIFIYFYLDLAKQAAIQINSHLLLYNSAVFYTYNSCSIFCQQCIMRYHHNCHSLFIQLT